MPARPLKLRFRRRLRRSQRQVEAFGQQAEAGLERNFLRRLSTLQSAWRFIIGWVGLVVLLVICMVIQIENLSNHYQVVEPVGGGTYTEGIVGSFSNANPLYATTAVDNTVSKLLFAGLLSYDTNNHLSDSLAASWQVNDLGTVYTVRLKPNLVWQDGRPLTADDVVFTYRAIQNPDAQSPLAGSWQGITIAKKDALTVTFTLPNPLSSFPYNLTTGIIPAHIFSRLAVSDWRSADFNSVHPVGAGPFAWSALQVIDGGTTSSQVLIALQPFSRYVGGRPRLDSFVIHTFPDAASLTKSFQLGQLTAAALPSPPETLTDNRQLYQYNFVITAATMAFFNTASGPLSDGHVRQALVQGTDVSTIMKRLGFTTKPVREPLLNGQLGYNKLYQQAAYDPAAAKAALTSAGWLVGRDGVRLKDGMPLELNFYAGNSGERQQVGRQLAAYWQALGARVIIHFQGATELHATVAARNYDVLLDSIAIGADPDVFVYWDSSQTDPRSANLNFSNYKSAPVDAALEAGRTRLNPSLRVIKYQPFLQAWQQDAPALGLYQPHYLYIARSKVYGLDARVVNSGTDRFNNVQNWMIRTAKTTD